jgi:hypothetical protein
MGIDSSTPSLFDQSPEQNGVSEPVLSPSKEFRLENPDFIEPIPVVHEWDPNERRSNRLRGSGGGLAAAVAGELALPSQADSIVPVDELTSEVKDTEATDEPVPMPDYVRGMLNNKNAKKFSINDIPLPEDSGGTEFRNAKSRTRRPGVI